MDSTLSTATPAPDTEQLFLPEKLSPDASVVDTWPYVNNICSHLSLNDAKLYRGYIKYFEEDRFTEQTLELMIKDANLFIDTPYVQWLHEDLVLVIVMNKLGSTDENTALAPVLDPGTDSEVTQKVMSRKEMVLSEGMNAAQMVTPSKTMTASPVEKPSEKHHEGGSLATVREKAQQMAMSAAGLSNVAFNSAAIFKMSGHGMKCLPRCAACRKRKVRCGHQDAGVGVVVGQGQGK